MKKSFTESQIISILREGEGGVNINDLIRKHNIVRSTYHKWKAKYGGMSVSDAVELRRLEQENNRLKSAWSRFKPRSIALKDVQKSGRAAMGSIRLSD